jgi:hypothetical protein
MAIEIHIRVRNYDWDSEHELAYTIADKIQTLITNNVTIPVLVIPVEDPENEMVHLVK